MINFSKSRHGNDLLTNLCESTAKFTDSQSLANKLEISRRSLFYTIKKVNSELSAADLDPISYIRPTGYFLSDKTRQALQNSHPTNELLPKISIQLKKTPRNNERQIIDTFLMISDYFPVISSLQQLYSVSKNTILSDIRYVKANLPEGLTMVNTPRGKAIAGPEMIKRSWVLSHLSTVLHFICVPNFDQHHSYIEKQLKQFEKITGSALTGNAFHSLLHYLDWYTFRITVKHYHLPVSDNDSALPYSLSNMWATRFLKGIKINNPAEVNYLSEIVNANQFSYIDRDNPMMNKLRPIAKQIVHLWVLSANASLSININKLIENLTVHLVPTYYRCKYHIQYHNPLLNEITTNYQETFQLTRLSVSPLEKYLNTKLSDDEISLISIYFGSDLRNQHRKKLKNEILVVCSSGIGTSHLLFSQLQNVYPSVNFRRPFNTLELENVNWSNVAGVISTLPVNYDRQVPHIQIQAMPSKTDWQTIQRFLIETNVLSKETASRINIESLIDVIAEYARIEHPQQLKQALLDFLLSAKSVNMNYPNRERFLGINQQYLQLFKSPTNWQAAIQQSFQPLEDAGTIDHSYTTKIIQSTIDHGDYMIIGNGIMLAHGGPADGVNKLGIGFNLFKQPFTSIGGQTIHIVITLAPVDAKLQVPFLEVMLKFASDKKWLKKVIASPTKDDLKVILHQSHLLAN